jgi:hypothetical protein
MLGVRLIRLDPFIGRNLRHVVKSSYIHVSAILKQTGTRPVGKERDQSDFLFLQPLSPIAKVTVQPIHAHHNPFHCNIIYSEQIA